MPVSKHRKPRNRRYRRPEKAAPWLSDGEMWEDLERSLLQPDDPAEDHWGPTMLTHVLPLVVRTATGIENQGGLPALTDRQVLEASGDLVDLLDRTPEAVPPAVYRILLRYRTHPTFIETAVANADAELAVVMAAMELPEV